MSAPACSTSARAWSSSAGVRVGQLGGLDQREDARERRAELVRHGCGEAGAELVEGRRCRWHVHECLLGIADGVGDGARSRRTASGGGSPSASAGRARAPVGSPYYLPPARSTRSSRSPRRAPGRARPRGTSPLAQAGRHVETISSPSSEPFTFRGLSSWPCRRSSSSRTTRDRRGMARHLNAAGFDPLWGRGRGRARAAPVRESRRLRPRPDAARLDGWKVIETARARESALRSSSCGRAAPSTTACTRSRSAPTTTS